MRLPAAFAAIALIAVAPDATIPADVPALLSSALEFTPADLADLARGKVVKRGLHPSAAGEIAVAGAVRVAARKELFIERLRDIERFKRGPGVLQIGRFGDHPAAGDLAPLRIGKEDFDLRRCRVGSCDIRLPADAIIRFQREIDWKAPDADARAASLFKQVLADHVRAYLTGGPGRIVEYDDEKRPVRPADDFAAVLENSPYVGAFAPGLPAHLKEPSRRLGGTDDFLYWSKERFGLTPFITVTHVAIAQVETGAYVVASRDVYSSRYVDASLSFTIASDAVGIGNAFYMVYVNRSRAYALKGPMAGLRRSIAERRARNALEETLRDVKEKLEREGGHVGPPLH